MISLESVTKIYPTGHAAIEALSLAIATGETFVCLGTSGSGKTTALRMINRLIEPTRGRILIDGRDSREQDPVALRRGMGYVVQEVGLFPHMTIAENIAVVPRLLGWPEARIEARLRELLEWMGLGLEEFRDRYPRQLSGGQRQRVGVARALAADPPIILMDEPFGALDPITRARLQQEFAELQERLRKTVVFVTHDILEAVRLADRIALMDRGRVQQVGPPAEIVERPANEFVARFLGEHRLYLRLLTRTVGSLLSLVQPPPAGPPHGAAPAEHLHLRQTMLQALELFKRAGCTALPVYEGDEYRGTLDKSALMGRISEILGEERGEASGE